MGTLSDLFKQQRVLICAGSGGVGKTTISAAIGLVAAQHGLRVLVLTVDPAKRLASTLGLDEQSNGEQQIEVECSGEYWASIINSQKTFDDFVRKTANNSELAERLLQNKLYRVLSGPLSGSQEFTSIVRLHSAINSKKYDLIVLDTPPAQHAIDFLKAPEKIQTLFDETIINRIVTILSKPKVFPWKILEAGTEQIFGYLEKLTGKDFLKDLLDFFVAINSWQRQIRVQTNEMQEIITHQQTSFCLVTILDKAKLAEAAYFKSSLHSLHCNLRALFINRAYPEWMIEAKNPMTNPQIPVELIKYYQQHCEVLRDKTKASMEKLGELQKEQLVVQIPELSDNISDLEGLIHFADLIGEL